MEKLGVCFKRTLERKMAGFPLGEWVASEDFDIWIQFITVFYAVYSTWLSKMSLGVLSGIHGSLYRPAYNQSTCLWSFNILTRPPQDRHRTSLLHFLLCCLSKSTTTKNTGLTLHWHKMTKRSLKDDAEGSGQEISPHNGCWDSTCLCRQFQTPLKMDGHILVQ